MKTPTMFSLISPRIKKLTNQSIRVLKNFSKLFKSFRNNVPRRIITFLSWKQNTTSRLKQSRIVHAYEEILSDRARVDIVHRLHGAETDDDDLEEESYQNSDVEDDDVDYILRFWEDHLPPKSRSYDEFMGKLTRRHSV